MAKDVIPTFHAVPRQNGAFCDRRSRRRLDGHTANRLRNIVKTSDIGGVGPSGRLWRTRRSNISAIREFHIRVRRVNVDATDFAEAVVGSIRWRPLVQSSPRNIHDDRNDDQCEHGPAIGFCSKIGRRRVRDRGNTSSPLDRNSERSAEFGIVYAKHVEFWIGSAGSLFDLPSGSGCRRCCRESSSAVRRLLSVVSRDDGTLPAPHVGEKHGPC